MAIESDVGLVLSVGDFDGVSFMSALALMLGVFVASWMEPVPTAAEARDNYDVITDVVYGHKNGMALTLDVFTPKSKRNAAGVVYIVSGGWISRWLPPERTVRRVQGLVDAGFTVFAVRHGSSPKYNIPEIVEDVRLAVRFIRVRAGEYGVDRDRIGAFGRSAGGHLALLLGTTADNGDASANDVVQATSDRVAAVVAYFPPVDIRPINRDPTTVSEFDFLAKQFPALVFDPTRAEAVSPVAHVTSDDAPALLIHGSSDFIVPISNSKRILTEFKEQGVPSQLLVIKNAGHGFRGDDAVRARKAAVVWFRKYLLRKKDTPGG